MNSNLAHTYPRGTSPPLSFKHVLAAAASSTLAPKRTVVIKFFERGEELKITLCLMKLL